MSEGRRITVATYQDERGASAFVAKELPYNETRSKSVYQDLNGVEIRGKRVLDVGCGCGRDVAYFASKGADAYGVDVSQPLLDEAVARYGMQGHFAALDALHDNEIPFGGGFDVIWLCQFLVHVPRADMPLFVEKLAGWMKPKGWMVINTKLGSGEKLNYHLGEDLPRLMVFYTIEEVMEYLRPLGFVEDWREDVQPLPGGDLRFGLRVRLVA